jgi:single-strand DNA-binding protein
LLNNVVLIGRLTRDPELRYTSQGTAVTNFGIAVDRGFGSDDENQQSADFFNVTCWNKLAEIVAQYMTKGRLVAVQGRLQSRNYEYNGQKRTAIEVVAQTVKFLDRQDNYQGNTSQGQVKNQNNSSQDYYKELDFNDDDDDLPF